MHNISPDDLWMETNIEGFINNFVKVAVNIPQYAFINWLTLKLTLLPVSYICREQMRKSITHWWIHWLNATKIWVGAQLWNQVEYNDEIWLKVM